MCVCVHTCNVFNLCMCELGVVFLQMLHSPLAILLLEGKVTLYISSFNYLQYIMYSSSQVYMEGCGGGGGDCN